MGEFLDILEDRMEGEEPKTPERVIKDYRVNFKLMFEDMCEELSEALERERSGIGEQVREISDSMKSPDDIDE